MVSSALGATDQHQDTHSILKFLCKLARALPVVDGALYASAGTSTPQATRFLQNALHHPDSAGIEYFKRDQVELRVYCMAKTIADCFKHRNKIGIDVALKALRDARTKWGSADEPWHYAKIFRVANIMRPYLEAVE